MVIAINSRQGVATKPNKHPSPEYQITGNEEFIVGGACACFLRMSSVLGVAPLRFTPHGNGYVVSISIPMCIYSYILVTTLAIAAFFALLSEHRKRQSIFMPFHVREVMIFSRITFYFAVSFGVFKAPLRMRRLFKCMSTIVLVDQSIGAKYSHAKERRLWRNIVFFIVSFSLILVGNIIYSLVMYIYYGKELHDFLDRSMFCISCLMSLILKMQFAFIVMSVRARFQAINKTLNLTADHLSVPYVLKTESPSILNILTRNVVPADLQSKTVIVSKSVNGAHRLVVSLSDAVQRISYLRCLLCDVVDDINNNFGIDVVFALISILLKLTYFTYSTFTEILHESRFHKMILQFLWLGLHVLMLFLMMEPCHYTIEESNKTENIVRRMMMESPSQGTLASRLKVFSRQLMLQRVGYKPMGFYILNRSLTASIFGIVIMHLSILFQFVEST